MSKHTHRIRPKGADKWQHVTADELKTITEQVGPRTLKANYQVEEMGDKPAPLPKTTSTPIPKPDESPVTTQDKEKDKK